MSSQSGSKFSSGDFHVTVYLSHDIEYETLALVVGSNTRSCVLCGREVTVDDVAVVTLIHWSELSAPLNAAVTCYDCCRADERKSVYMGSIREALSELDVCKKPASVTYPEYLEASAVVAESNGLISVMLLSIADCISSSAARVDEGNPTPSDCTLAYTIARAEKYGECCAHCDKRLKRFSENLSYLVKYGAIFVSARKQDDSQGWSLVRFICDECNSEASRGNDKIIISAIHKELGNYGPISMTLSAHSIH